MASEKECIAAYFESFNSLDCLRYASEYGCSWDEDETVSKEKEKECIAAYFDSLDLFDCLRCVYENVVKHM